MSDLKISQLGPFSETDVVASDVLPLADVSAQQTKKIAASDLVKAGARLNADTITFGNNVVVTGNFTVNGTTTTIDTTTLRVEDKNIEMGVVATPTDVTANGGGITLKGTTDKTINWLDATDSWTSSENVDLASGKSYRINNTEVLNSTTLGSGVTSSSLTSVGTVTTGTWQGTTVATGYGGTGQTTYSNGQLLIGKTDGTLAKSTITAGSGVTVTNGDGAITIAATGSGGTVTNVTGTAPISVANGTTTPSISIAAASTSAAGAVQLTDSTSSTSTTTAATPNAVKSAYDLADAALPEAGGTMTGALGVTAGTAAAPGVFFSGDTNTGIYSPGADQVAISTNGERRLLINSAGRVCIGASDPGLTFDVRSWGAAGDRTVGITGYDYATSFRSVYLQYYDVSATGTRFGTNNANSGQLIFQNVENALIGANGTTPLIFATLNTERLRITSDGKVGIGTSSPGGILDIRESNSGGTALAQLANTSNTASSNARFKIATGGTSAGNPILQFTNDTSNWYINADQSDSFKLKIGTTISDSKFVVDSSGRVGIGTASPDAPFKVATSSTSNGVVANFENSSTGALIQYGQPGVANWRAGVVSGADAFAIYGFGSGSYPERLRVDSSGRLLVGTSTARNNLFGDPNIYSGFQLEGAGIVPANRFLSIVNNYDTSADGDPMLVLGRTRGSAVGGGTIVQSGDQLGSVSFQGSQGSSVFREAARIQAFVDGTPGANDMPGRLVFSTTADGASSPTERMRITNGGNVTIGSDGNTTLFNQTSVTGVVIERAGAIQLARSGDQSLLINRITNDGTLVGFYQDGTQEGTISVSGSTVSYNGAHLSRWSQLPSGQERTEILRGTVLSNIDEMCEWGEEDNEQLNRMKVSDVEGDKNVSGVFQAWDDDDDTYTNDFYCAMTGDFIIRIGAGVTVERGDLLMSAGDGTAKPQDDDIIRSKTIAKVTSTNVSCTYDDGSYCVPCVLMAC